MGDMGQPADIAEMIAYLASPKARFITGATIDVNGGVRMA
jgi:3-oxoacyl-[acyl-carrier protein] reductase